MLQAPVIGFILALSSSKDAFVLRSQWPDAERLMAMMSCSVLWFGIINSAREVVKELPIYKRERFVNLNIFAYLLSKVTILIGICAVQCWLLLTALVVSGIRLNGSGRILLLFWEFYLDLLFVALVGLALGLLVSCTVATSERVTSAIPIVLLPQIILNPVLLSNPTGFLEMVVNLTIASKWGLVALGNSSDMIKKVPPGYTNIYTSTPSGLLSAWAVLILMSLVCLALAYYMLSRKED